MGMKLNRFSRAVQELLPAAQPQERAGEPSRMALLFIDALCGLGFVTDELRKTAIDDELALYDGSEEVENFTWDRAALATLDEHELRDLYVNLKVIQASMAKQGVPA